jgi:hypothetical protein
MSAATIEALARAEVREALDALKLADAQAEAAKAEMWDAYRVAAVVPVTDEALAALKVAADAATVAASAASAAHTALARKIGSTLAVSVLKDGTYTLRQVSGWSNRR